ncbi:CAZyme family GH16 [Paecilomyces variotii]|nr:CAZyme family GH16 [Paecilomyces variotii]KAJ9202619.1 CAZyme family GH16 [Paecilomyces variotii]KAJ9224498.1 CAZyme family GH16 [Paecilomyces variotii]KAJ9265805.1 CAZyme family GH16 [Paecilomyces variotii]KAJ9283078.1 CAZyme family GH16 [Paecilomyces variotii]
MPHLSAIFSLATLAYASTTVIPTSCFNSYSELETYFGYLYPWGSDHNGAARMVGNSSDHDYITIKTAGTLTLTAVPTSGQPATSGGIDIDYLSGTVYALNKLTVESGSGYDIQASFQAPTEKGTWPAFWVTGANSWPPEIDIAEWKGNGDISFNTFNTSSSVEAKNLEYDSPDNFHTVKAEIRDEDGSNISVKFYLDGTLMTTQYGSDYISEPLWLIIDLQMEGSSGSPGPTTNTTYSIKDLSVVKI